MTDSDARRGTGADDDRADSSTRADGQSDQSNDKQAGNQSEEQKGADSKNENDQDQKPRSKWPLIILAIVVVLAIIGGVLYWLSVRDLEATDDAYTEGDAVAIAPKVAGYVVELNITDNSFVHAGDILLRIDPRDYVAAKDQAAADLSLARAQLASAEIDLTVARVRAPAQLQQAQAQLSQARSNQAFADRTLQRQRAVDQRATTQTDVDQASSQARSNSAAVSSAQAQAKVAALVQESIASSEQAVAQRRAQVSQAQAGLAQTELNLSYTVLRAPQDGHVTKRNVQLGTYAQAGQQVFYLVTPVLWITANFKETQLNRMRLGQSVTIGVDAFPDLRLHGHIDSIQYGSGDRFSTFPAENATGNYVKIVRRVPVKIVIDDGIDQRRGLPLGLSVTPTVKLK